MLVKFQCLNCKKESQIQCSPSRSSPKYCNNSCRLEHKKAKVSIYGISKCENCGKEFKWKRPIHQGPARRCNLKCYPKYLKDKELFDYKVKLYNERVIKNPEGCWDWNGIIDSKQKYARIQVQHTNTSAHRISWMMIHGEIPQKMCVLHKCDNRKCTNPDHLYLGTYIENDRDRVERNRQAKGSKNGSAKLNEQQVKEIKIMLKNGFTQKEIAIKFNMSQATIGFIASGRLWKHVIID